MATLPPGLPVWLRWTLAAPIMAVALVGPVLAVVLIGAAGYPDRGNRSVLQSANNLYGSVWFVLAVAIPGVIAVVFLWRQILAWHAVYVIVVSVVVVLWTATTVLFDATDRATTQPWIVPLGGGIGAWAGGYLLTVTAIRILTTPGARLAESSMEMVVPMRRCPGARPWQHGWIRMQWDRVRLEADHRTGTAIMAWWAMRSVQAGEFTYDNELQVTEVDSPQATARIDLDAGPGVRLEGEPGTLYASCADPSLVAEAIAARVAWAARRPWTEGPDTDVSTARSKYDEARMMVTNTAGRFALTNPLTLVFATIAFGLMAISAVYLGIRNSQHSSHPVHAIVVAALWASVLAGLDVCAALQLRTYLRGQRFLEANDEPVPDQPPTPWLARGEPIFVRPEISEDPDKPFILHKPVRSARRATPPHGRRHR